MAPVPQPSLDASPAGVPPPVHKPPTTKYDAAPRRPEGRIFVSPLARKIAIDKSIDLSQVQGDCQFLDVNNNCRSKIIWACLYYRFSPVLFGSLVIYIRQ